MTGVLIAICAISYAAAIVLIDLASSRANGNYVGTVVNSVGALLPFLIYLVVAHGKVTPATNRSMWFAIAGGLAIGVFTVALTKLFSVGDNLAFVTPLVYGGAILLSSLYAIAVLKEKAPSLELIGLGLIVLGSISIALSRWSRV